MKAILRQIDSFLEQNDPQAWLGSALFHMGLIWANLPLFVLGVYLLPSRPGATIFAISACLWPLMQGRYFYQALIEVQSYPILICIGVLFLWVGLWGLWCWVYTKLRFSVLRATWCFLLGRIGEVFGVGFLHLSPMLVGSPWEVIVPYLGGFTIWWVIWLSFQLRLSLIGNLLWLFPLLFVPVAELYVPEWIGNIDIHPEGRGSISHHSAVIGMQLQEDKRVYLAALGTGEVFGVSLKRHLVPFVESGYTSANGSRILSYLGKKLLVLVCYDALFSDVAFEAQESDVIIVVSDLQRIDTAPIKQYFSKQIRYIQLVHQTPVVWRTTGSE